MWSLADLRHARGWTRKQLARRSGVGERTIIELEAGQRARVRRRTIEALAAALQVNPDAVEEFHRYLAAAREVEAATPGGEE